MPPPDKNAAISPCVTAHIEPATANNMPDTILPLSFSPNSKAAKNIVSTGLNVTNTVALEAGIRCKPSIDNTVKPNTPNAAANANPSHCLRDKTAKVRNRYRANSQPKSKIAAVKKRSIPPVKGGSACPSIRPIGQDAPQNAAMPNSFTWIAKCFMVMDNLDNRFRKRIRSVWKGKFP